MIGLDLVDVLALFCWSKPEEVVERYFEFFLHFDDLETPSNLESQLTVQWDLETQLTLHF